MAMPVMFKAFWVSEKTNVKVWLVPVLALGETELAVGSGGGTVAVQIPLETNAVVFPLVSMADKYTVSLPVKLAWNETEMTTVRVLPDSVT